MRLLVFLVTAAFAGVVAADNLSFDVQGIEGSQLTNARSQIENLVVSDSPRITERRLNQLKSEAEQRVKDSLKPYGYYHAQVTSTVESGDEGPRTIVLNVKRGSPVRVIESEVTIDGPGSDIPELEEWLDNWPLPVGKVLNQSRWEAAKREASNILEYRGFFKMEFVEHRIEIDLDRNEAVLKLALETGPRAVLGQVRFDQDVVEPELLQKLPRFDVGQPYDGWLLEKLRYDLWQTGFYSTIDVIEDRQLDADPPIVNLNAKLEARNRDTWQGSLGVGSDTGARAQGNWNRHWLSPRGDSLGMALGWQQRDNRYLFRTNYRLPRGDSRRSYWIAETLYRDEDEDLQMWSR
jgi:translocation and assembly module TamA